MLFCRTLAVVLAIMRDRACGSTGGTSGGTRRLSIATGGTGGVFYPYGGGIAKVLTEHLPNTEVTAEVTAASVDNLKFIKQGNSDLAFSMADIAADAAAGRDAFKDFGAVPVRVHRGAVSELHAPRHARRQRHQEGGGSARAGRVDRSAWRRHHGPRRTDPVRRPASIR